MSTPVKALNKAYKKGLKKLNKQFFISDNTGLLLFVEYLKYRRDALILQSYDEAVISTCVAAIAEFSAYASSSESSQKQFHWNNFCELLKQNMEDWLQQNDSV